MTSGEFDYLIWAQGQKTKIHGGTLLAEMLNCLR
jgi:hypothetical protein